MRSPWGPQVLWWHVSASNLRRLHPRGSSLANPGSCCPTGIPVSYWLLHNHELTIEDPDSGGPAAEESQKRPPGVVSATDRTAEGAEMFKAKAGAGQKWPQTQVTMMRQDYPTPSL